MNNNPNNNKKPNSGSSPASRFFRRSSNNSNASVEKPKSNSNAMPRLRKLVRSSKPIQTPTQTSNAQSTPVNTPQSQPANSRVRKTNSNGFLSKTFSGFSNSFFNFFKGPWTLSLVIRRGLTAIGMLLLVGIGFFFFFAATAPNITESELASENVTEIYDSQGTSVWSLSSQERNYADQEEVPQKLKDAIISIEDRRFLRHKGVDPIRIMGALVNNLTGSSGLQGGSTLTQQLVKLSVFSTSSADQTLKRKAQEAWLALKVERNFSKDEILTFYVNKVYEGNGVYGMKTAAGYYYGTTMKELNLSQTAIIAGIPQQPKNFDPYAHADWLKDRRQEVLSAMLANKKITKAEYEEASNADVLDGIIPEEDQIDNEASESDLVVDAYVQSTLDEAKKLGYNPTTDNLRIYTSLNSNIQNNLFDAVNGATGIYMPDGLQVGATMTNPKNGRVIAQIGGRNLDTELGLNRAVQTTRSSGSTIKPLADYAPAVEYLNWPTYRTVSDEPYNYPGTNISVANFDRKFQGNITMRRALAGSRNVPAIKTFMEVGAENSAEFLNGLGIDIKAENMVASDAVGIDFSTEQGAAAFAAFANGGTYYQPSYIERIVTSDGNAITFDAPKGKKAMKDSTAFEMITMMKDVIKSEGTAPGASIPGIYAAGKSGTVGYDVKAGQPEGAISDEWFIGFTKLFCLAIWTGYDQPNEPGNYIRESGISTPDSIFSQVMGFAMRGKENSDWKAPKSVQAVNINGVIEYEVAGKDFENGGRLDPSSSSVEPEDSDEEESSSSSSESSKSSSIDETVPTNPTPPPVTPPVDPGTDDDIADDGNGGSGVGDGAEPATNSPVAATP